MSTSLAVIIRDFKRHYHNVRAFAESLTDKGDFKFQVKFDGSNLQAEHSTPDDEETIQFVVLMRRFLSPSDSLFYKKVWTSLKEEFSEEISVDIVSSIEKAVEDLNKGRLGIEINGEDLTAEKVYRLLSDGEYFGHNQDAQKYLKSLKNLPMVGPLFWHQFYAYTLEGFSLVYTLFDSVIQVEKSKKYEVLYGNTATIKAQCIYCLTTTATFSSEEHVFPEALGNDELVLPRGYVCTQCNNGILARLDEALLNFGPIALLQVQFVPYKKDGKSPKANFQNLSIERKGPKSIVIKAKDKTGRIKNKKHLGDNWYSFTSEIRGKKFDPKLLGRSLYKIALGAVAFFQGHTQACNPKYNVARSFILEDQDFHNNLLMSHEVTPHPRLRLGYSDLQEGTPFMIDIYGLVFQLHLEENPALGLSEELAQAKFAMYSLSG